MYYESYSSDWFDWQADLYEDQISYESEYEYEDDNEWEG